MASIELHKTLTIIILSVNIFICLIIVVLLYPFCKKKSNISKDLRIYFMFCLEPYILLLIILSSTAGIHFFIYGTIDTTTFKIFRILLAYFSIQIRYTYFFLVLSRIFATIFYKKYSKSSGSKRSIVINIIITYIVSLANGYLEFTRIFVNSNLYGYTIYIAFGQHAVTLILCKILDEVNKRKYQSLAYQSSLSERHQIYKNVKLLKTIWPMIFIFSTISPIGPLLVIVYSSLMGFGAPTSLYYSFYNLGFLVIICWRLTLPNENNFQHINTIGKEFVQATAKNSRGKMQAAVIPVEKYFNDLKMQWK